MNWNVLRILSLSDKLSQEVVFLFLSIYQSWRICMVGRAIISFLFCKLSTFLNFLYLHHHQIISLKCSNKNLILFWSSIVEKRKERKYLKHSDLFGKSQNCANKESDSFWPILKSSGRKKSKKCQRGNFSAQQHVVFVRVQSEF